MKNNKLFQNISSAFSHLRKLVQSECPGVLLIELQTEKLDGSQQKSICDLGTPWLMQGYQVQVGPLTEKTEPSVVGRMSLRCEGKLQWQTLLLQQVIYVEKKSIVFQRQDVSACQRVLDSPDNIDS